MNEILSEISSALSSLGNQLNKLIGHSGLDSLELGTAVIVALVVFTACRGVYLSMRTGFRRQRF
jgi:hypothetical protein